MDIFAVDYSLESNNGLEISYCFLSVYNSIRIFLKTFVISNSSVPSLSSFYKSSNWLEREVWDFFGTKFSLHPDLRRILTDYGFSGHPLRKNFPLVGFIEYFYDDIFQVIIAEPVELFQALRIFYFVNSWFGWTDYE
jgi:NADH:ubiquinone oxidoreductase subunit C